MKRFKTAITLLLAATLCLALLAGCGSDKSATWEGQLGNKGTLRVGISPDYPPYESYDADGNIVGFDAAVADYIAKQLGCKVELVPMDFDTIISAVNAGTVDVGISCFSYKEDRDVLFSTTYLTSSQAIVVAVDSGITAPSGLAGGTIGAGEGTTGLDAANTLAETYSGITVTTGDIAVMMENLKAGALQGVVTERPVAQSYANSNPDVFVVLPDELTKEETKVIAKKGNDLLMAEVNKAIDAFLADAGYNDLIVKYFS